MKASTIFINILSLASLYLAVSCNEEEQHGQTVRTIMATIEQSSTRTALDGPDADGVYKTIWSSDDAIAVFSGNNAASEFKLTSGANTNTAEFEGNAASDNMVAIYPYSIVKGRTGSTISVTLPEVQEYVSGNIPQGAYPMAAVSDGAVLPFYNLCSVLRLRMFGDLTVNSITFTPNDATVKTSGNATVNAGDKMLTMSGDAKSTVRLNCANGVKLTRTSTDFLMVVPAQKYTGGFTITINTDQGAVVKAVKSDVTLSRSVLYPIKAFECKIEQSKDNIVFEDANFKAYMVTNFDTNNDGEISYEEALNVTKIEVNTDNITSLAGIEYMQNLQYLSCEGSSKWNSATRKVDIYGKLTSLDLSNNTKLSFLHVSYNPLISLDVDHNPKLQELYCICNNLSSLNIRNNAKLQNLDCFRNNLSALNVSANPELINLSCGINNISSLDVKNNTKLEYLECSSNNISSLDVRNNQKLEHLICGWNNLSSLDVSNNLKLLSLDCSSSNLSTLSISNNLKLRALYCYLNNLSTLQLSNNPELGVLWCHSNNLSALDVSNNPKLQELNCDNNKLSSLDVFNNPKLEMLYCNENILSSLDISNNTAMKYLYAMDNPLATLFIHEGQTNSFTEIQIPSTTKIVVKGSEEPEEWAGKEFWHKSLAMKFTATWCAPCATMASSFEKAMTLYPNKIEEINIHNDTDFPFDSYSGIASIFKVNSFPSVFVDLRKRVYNNDNAPSLLVEAVKETESNYPTKTGISFTSTVTGNTLDLNMKLYIKEKGDYKVTAVLLEDGLVAAQNGAGNNFVHNHTARKAISDITGDVFSTTANNKTVEKNYSVTLPSSYNKDNLRILVYVLKQYGSQTIIRTADYGDYYVDNATSAAIGTTKDLIFADGSTYGGNEDTKDGGEITLK